MAIDANEITSEITLEFDEEVISIADFKAAFDNFTGLVKEVSKYAAPSRNASAWVVNFYPGSAGIGLAGMKGEFSREDTNSVRALLLDGLKAIAQGIRPPQFNDKAIEYSKNLASLFKSNKAEPAVRVWSRRDESLTVSREIADHASEMLSVSYEEDGTVEGMLEKLDSHGKLQFVIYDVIDNHPVKCEVNEQQLEQACGNFRKRVEVIGIVRYGKDGMPVSIKASRIVPFPDKSNIPTIQQMRSLLSGA